MVPAARRVAHFPDLVGALDHDRVEAFGLTMKLTRPGEVLPIDGKLSTSTVEFEGPCDGFWPRTQADPQVEEISSCS